MDDDRPVTRRDLNELKQELKQEMKHLADSMTELMRDIETKMLTAFHELETRQGR